MSVLTLHFFWLLFHRHVSQKVASSYLEWNTFFNRFLVKAVVNHLTYTLLFVKFIHLDLNAFRQTFTILKLPNSLIILLDIQCSSALLLIFCDVDARIKMLSNVLNEVATVADELPFESINNC